MKEYYSRRAQEYEQIYHRDDPSRQGELELLSRAMCDTLADLNVLEVACGTGFWTERVATSARRVVATDASEEMLQVASGKCLPPNVHLARADAYDFSAVGSGFTGGLANFWFSHVPKDRLSEFLGGFHAALASRARIFLTDNCYEAGVGGDQVSIKGQADTYKRRYLSDGSEHLVLKNYYSQEELSGIFSQYSDDVRINVGTHYWWLAYSLRSNLAT
jgi:SAM-dependent methyltransferase